MDFLETSEQQMLRESVGKIAADFGHDYFLRQSRTDGRATALWRALGEAGFMGVNLPEEHGGAGQGILELAMVAEEAAAQGCPLLLMVVSPAICGGIIARYGYPEQQARWLPTLADGTTLLAFAITEPDAGSNSHNLSTTARRDGDGWVLNGRKYYISGVDEAEAILVVARTGVDDTTGRGRLSLFLVDTDAPGLQAEPIPMEISAPEKQYTLYLDDVRLGDDRLVGDEGDGLRQVFHGLNPERIMSAAMCVGIGRYALDKASTYANDRQVWGTPIGAHQGLAHPLAECKIALEQAKLMTCKAAWLHDRDHPGAGEAANIAKFAGADAALRCLDQSIQTHGGNGLATEYGLADLWGLTRLMRTAPVSREMILNFVAQHSLGLPRSY